MDDSTLPAKLLLVDDDPVFSRVAARTLARRGFDVAVARDVVSAVPLAVADTAFAVVDLVLGDASGLQLLPKLKAANPAMRILVLSGYASIATAVEAIKRGATNYLAKPADADTIVAALLGAPSPVQPLPLQRLQSKHLQRILAECDGNISAAARTLNMHRRTLQRKLARLAPAR